MKKAKLDEEIFINMEKLAERTGLTESFIKKAMYKYKLPYFKLGRLVRFKYSEVVSWIEQRRAA